MADLLIEAGRLAEAQFVLDLVKEQEIFEFVRRDTSHGDPRTGRIALNAQERRFDQAIQDALARPLWLAAEARALRDKHDGEDLSDSERDRLTVLEDTLDEAYAAFVSQVDAILAVASDASRQVEREVRALDLDYTLDIQGELERFDSRAVLLRIASLEETLHLFVTTPDISVSRQVQVPREVLSLEVFEAIEAIEKRSPEATERLRTLYGRLIGPIEQDFKVSGAKVIMLSLDGFLRYVCPLRHYIRATVI